MESNIIQKPLESDFWASFTYRKIFVQGETQKTPELSSGGFGPL